MTATSQRRLNLTKAADQSGKTLADYGQDLGRKIKQSVLDSLYDLCWTKGVVSVGRAQIDVG